MRREKPASVTGFGRTDHSEVVVGQDIVMIRRGEQITLHTLDERGRHLLGTYCSVAAAWGGLDEFDAVGGDDVEPSQGEYRDGPITRLSVERAWWSQSSAGTSKKRNVSAFAGPSG